MDRSVGVSSGDGELGCYCDGEELETALSCVAGESAGRDRC